ncbi:MAG: hypothetical protein AABY22_28085 [Nanoarchaeota archaeon]
MSLRHILYDVRLFEREEDREIDRKKLLGFLESLVWANRLWLKQHPEAPRLYQSKIKYALPQQYEGQALEVAAVRRAVVEEFGRAPREGGPVDSSLADINALVGGERFRDYPALIEAGEGDCDQIACVRVAELRNEGVEASPYITWRRRADGGMTYHALVWWPDGSSEDPSLLLGMGGAAKAKEREEERKKLAERAKNQDRKSAAKRVAGKIIKEIADRKAEEVIGDASNDPDFGKGVFYTQAYWNDPSYENYRPGPPDAFYQDPFFPGMVTASPFDRPALWQEGGSRFDRDDDDDLDGTPEFSPYAARNGFGPVVGWPEFRTFRARYDARRGKTEDGE